jgi:methylated-DNA-[protein]-cysteine S-methyltransferase
MPTTPDAHADCPAITFSTALGQFSVAGRADGAILATAFGGLDALAGRLPRGTRPVAGPAATRALSNAREEFTDYLAGRRTDFDLVLAPEGTAFQKRVWAALRAIPRGKTRTYGELAEELGSSARAVGRANATNPLCVIVPCHRVVGADGALTGFAFGVETKSRLLALEARA